MHMVRLTVEEFLPKLKCVDEVLSVVALQCLRGSVALNHPDMRVQSYLLHVLKLVNLLSVDLAHAQALCH